MDNTVRYRNFIATYQKAYCSSGSKDKILRAGQEEWNKVKLLPSNVYDEHLAKLTAMATKCKANLMQIWATAASDKKIVVTAESKLGKLQQKIHNSPTSPSSTTSMYAGKASVNPQTSPSDTSSILAESASETERTGQNIRETPA